MQNTTELATIIVEALQPEIDKLETARNVATPSTGLAIEAIAGCLNSRSGQWRKSKPTKSETAELLWQLLRFHGGNGSLWGFPWFADSETRDQLDTLAILLRGNHSSAANAWSRAINDR